MEVTPFIVTISQAALRGGHSVHTVCVTAVHGSEGWMKETGGQGQECSGSSRPEV